AFGDLIACFGTSQGRRAEFAGGRKKHLNESSPAGHGRDGTRAARVTAGWHAREESIHAGNERDGSARRSWHDTEPRWLAAAPAAPCPERQHERLRARAARQRLRLA